MGLSSQRVSRKGRRRGEERRGEVGATALCAVSSVGVSSADSSSKRVSHITDGCSACCDGRRMVATRCEVDEVQGSG